MFFFLQPLARIDIFARKTYWCSKKSKQVYSRRCISTFFDWLLIAIDWTSCKRIQTDWNNLVYVDKVHVISMYEMLFVVWVKLLQKTKEYI